LIPLDSIEQEFSTIGRSNWITGFLGREIQHFAHQNRETDPLLWLLRHSPLQTTVILIVQVVLRLERVCTSWMLTIELITAEK
jgi:hypothetical protein